MNTQNAKKLYSYFIIWYIILFSLYSIMTRIAGVNLLINGSINSWTYRSFFIFGIFLFLMKFYVNMHWFKTKLLIVPAIFILISCISTISNLKYNFSGNIALIGWTVIQLSLYFMLAFDISKDMLIKCLHRIALLCSVIWNIACLISLVLYVFDKSYCIMYLQNRLLRQGNIDGRLFGIFIDPNFASIVCFVLILLLYYTIKTMKYKFIKVYSWISIVILTYYLVAANSRTIFITALCSLLVFVFLNVMKKKCPESPLQIIKYGLLTIVCTTATLLAVYFVSNFTLHLVGDIVTPERNTATDLVREDVDIDNITNNRSRIWKAYATLTMDKPVFGLGPGSALTYAKKNYPTGYLAQSSYRMHSGYVTILVTSGIVGVLLMLAALILYLKSMLGIVFKPNLLNDEYILGLSIVAAVLVIALCFSEMFFTNNIETLLFWVFFGSTIKHYQEVRKIA